MALAVVERAGDQRHTAILVERDLAELLAWRRGHLEIGADRDAAQFSALAALLLAFGEAGIVGSRQRVRHHGREVAAVILHARRRIERHLRALDEILLAQLDAVDAHRIGCAISRSMK